MGNSVLAPRKIIQSKFSDKTANILDWDTWQNYRTKDNLRKYGGLSGSQVSQIDHLYDAYENHAYTDLLAEVGGGTTTTTTAARGFTPFSGANPEMSHSILNSIGVYWGSGKGVGQHGRDPFEKTRRSFFENQRNFAGYETDDFLDQTTLRTKELRKDKAIRETINTPGRITPNSTRAATSTVKTYNVGDKDYEDAWERANKDLFGGSVSEKSKGNFSLEGLGEGEDNFVINEKVGKEINDAFIDEEFYNKLSDEHKQFYGLTVDQAREADPLLDAVYQVGSAAQQTWDARKAANKGGGFFKKALSVAAPLVGNFLAPGVGGVFGGAVGGAISGGGIEGILKGGLLGGLASGGLNKILSGTNLGSQIGQTGINAFTGAASNALQGGDLRSILGGAITGGLETPGALSKLTNNGTGNMSWLSDIFNKGKELLGGAGSTLGNILSGGVKALGGAGGLVDILIGKGGSGGVVGSLLDYQSQKDAQRTSEKASDQAIGLADPQARHRPYYAGRLRQLMDNPDEVLRQDPSYQFRFDQGEEAVRRKSAASGDRMSGGGILASLEYGQNFASTEFNNAFNRLNTLATGSPAAAQVQHNAGLNNAAGTASRYRALGGIIPSVGGALADILKGNKSATPGFNPYNTPPNIDDATYGNLWGGYQ